MPAIAHRSSRTLWVPFRRCSQVLPGTRGNMLHHFTLCRGALFSHKVSPAYCPSGILTPHFRGVKPGLGFQTIHRASPHTTCPPITATQATSDTLPLSYVASSRHPLQPLIDTSIRGNKRDPTHVHVASQGLQRTSLAAR